MITLARFPHAGCSALPWTTQGPARPTPLYPPYHTQKASKVTTLGLVVGPHWYYHMLCVRVL
jgi:hypothetical protein